MKGKEKLWMKTISIRKPPEKNQIPDNNAGMIRSDLFTVINAVKSTNARTLTHAEASKSNQTE